MSASENLLDLLPAHALLLATVMMPPLVSVVPLMMLLLLALLLTMFLLLMLLVLLCDRCSLLLVLMFVVHTKTRKVNVYTPFCLYSQSPSADDVVLYAVLVDWPSWIVNHETTEFAQDDDITYVRNVTC